MRSPPLTCALVGLALACPPLACRTAANPTEPSPSHYSGARATHVPTPLTPTAPASADRKSPPAKAGWGSVDRATAQRIETLADDYLVFLGSAKTARTAVTQLTRLFALAGGRDLATDPRPARTPGSRHYFVSGNGDAAVYIRLGREPLERGARVVVVPVEAPHIQLKQRPIYDKAGVTLFDTTLRGQLSLPSWLSRPLALHVHLDRPGAADGDLHLAIGESADDPVLVIPDLLPHLSRKIQRRSIVDSPERLDAVAAHSQRALLELLASHGIDKDALAAAETALVPAGPPVFVGIDRGLIAGHGHSHRALAYAALRALSEGRPPELTAVVIAVRSTGRDASNSGLSFAREALSRALGALTEAGDQLDVLSTRRFYARTTALVATVLTGDPNAGLILAPLSDDATPLAHRRVIDRLDGVGAPYQMSGKPGFGPGRLLSPLDLDAVEIDVPVRGRGAPSELLSTLDLYYAWQSATAWLTGS